MAIDVLVADPDPAHREWLTALLLRAGFRTSAVALGADLIEMTTAEHPSVLVLEVCLPDISGLELCREFRDRYGESLGILLMSQTRTEPLDRTAGILVGADDYLTTPLDPSEFIARVRRAVTRARGADAAHAARTVADDRDRLTRRELDVLELLARGLRQVEIAQALVLTEKTVSTHIQHILAKLGVHSRAEAVAVAFRMGLVSLEVELPADREAATVQTRDVPQGTEAVDVR